MQACTVATCIHAMYKVHSHAYTYQQLLDIFLCVVYFEARNHTQCWLGHAGLTLVACLLSSSLLVAHYAALHGCWLGRRWRYHVQKMLSRESWHVARLVVEERSSHWCCVCVRSGRRVTVLTGHQCANHLHPEPHLCMGSTSLAINQIWICHGHVQEMQNYFLIPPDSFAKRGIVGKQLICAINSTHVLIVAQNAVRFADSFTATIDLWAVRELSSVKSRQHEHVPIVMPLCDDDTFVSSAWDFSLLQLRSYNSLWKKLSVPSQSTADQCFPFQQLICEWNAVIEVVNVEFMAKVQSFVHQFHYHCFCMAKSSDDIRSSAVHDCIPDVPRRITQQI